MAALRSPYGVDFPDTPIPGLNTFVYFAAAFFAATLITDFAYIQTLVLMWKDFSSWLLFFGLIAGAIATILWLIGLVMRRHHPVWSIVVVNILVLVAAIVNSLVHAVDGWTAIVPWGIALSALTCVLMLGSAVLKWRHVPFATRTVP